MKTAEEILAKHFNCEEYDLPITIGGDLFSGSKRWENFTKLLNAIDDYANQKQPEAKPKDADEFDNYIGEARDQFVVAVENQEWDVKLRTEAEDLLIAFDQMRERLRR